MGSTGVGSRADRQRQRRIETPINVKEFKTFIGSSITATVFYSQERIDYSMPFLWPHPLHVNLMYLLKSDWSIN